MPVLLQTKWDKRAWQVDSTASQAKALMAIDGLVSKTPRPHEESLFHSSLGKFEWLQVDFSRSEVVKEVIIRMRRNYAPNQIRKTQAAVFLLLLDPV